MFNAAVGHIYSITGDFIFDHSSKDPFPEDDIVWGIQLPFLTTEQYIWYEYFEGVAYTIDPIYEAEVRDYLGTQFSYGVATFPSD